MSHYTCTCTVFDKDRLNGAPIVRGCLNVGVHTVLYLYSVRHGQPEMCLLYVRPCAWTCTLYVYVRSVWHGHLSDAPIVRKPVCLGVHTVRVRVQCLAYGLNDAPIVPKSVYLGVHTVRVHVQCLA